MNRSVSPPSSDFLNLLKSPPLHAFAIFFAIWMLSQRLSPHSTDKQALLRSVVLQLVLVLGLPLIASRIAELPLLQIFKLHATSVRNLLLTVAATVCLIVLLSEIRFLQSRWIGQESNLVEQFLRAVSPSQWIKLVLCMAIIPAVCEESLFRGYLLDRLAAPDQPWRSIMITSVLFGLFHQGFQTVPPAIVAGIFFAFVATRTRSLVSPVVSHSVVNAWAIFAANSDLAKTLCWLKYPGYAPILVLAICSVGIFLLGGLLEKDR